MASTESEIVEGNCKSNHYQFFLSYWPWIDWRLFAIFISFFKLLVKISTLEPIEYCIPLFYNKIEKYFVKTPFIINSIACFSFRNCSWTLIDVKTQLYFGIKCTLMKCNELLLLLKTRFSFPLEKYRKNCAQYPDYKVRKNKALWTFSKNHLLNVFRRGYLKMVFCILITDMNKAMISKAWYYSASPCW